MAVTKTDFINYIRCPRYVALEKIHKDKLEAEISFEEYKKNEHEYLVREVLSNMYSYDESGEDVEEDLIDIKDDHLEAMLKYYKELELLAGKHVEKIFGGNTTYSKDTFHQESFDFVKEGIRYLCYVDILNEEGNNHRIIEVKSTTTKKFLELGYTKNKEFYPIFIKCNDGILRLVEEVDPQFLNTYDVKKYYEQKNNLMNRYKSTGHYVYDLALQRYIIENDLITHNQNSDDYSYFLAILNSEYIFEGTYENDKPIYNKDQFNNDLITLIDLTSLTKEMQEVIKRDEEKVRNYIYKSDASKYKLGEYCEYKKTTKCKFVPVCFKEVLKDNSILCYLNKHHGFKDSNNIKHELFDLIEEGYFSMIDVPDDYLHRQENIIQKQVVKNNNPYINLSKIKNGIKSIEYPIYHLDFETFNCPLPRYRGEKPYQQSVFQFSLHIEETPGICDKNKNHFEFLAEDHKDHREELIKKLIEYIDISKGTILVYNETFEKTRLKELADIFPQYKKELLRMKDMVFDLFYIIKTNNKFYQSLGFSEEEAKLFNYYHPNLNGSFSIKRVLPLFTNLSYKDLEVGNGMEAIVAYASYEKLNQDELKNVLSNLKEYCKQDTWAMVEILNGIRKLVK